MSTLQNTKSRKAPEALRMYKSFGHSYEKHEKTRKEEEADGDTLQEAFESEWGSLKR